MNQDKPIKRWQIILYLVIIVPIILYLGFSFMLNSMGGGLWADVQGNPLLNLLLFISALPFMIGGGGLILSIILVLFTLVAYFNFGKKWGRFILFLALWFCILYLLSLSGMQLILFIGAFLYKYNPDTYLIICLYFWVASAFCLIPTIYFLRKLRIDNY